MKHESIKQLAFPLLCVIFIIYSWMVYTTDSNFDKGSQHLSYEVIKGKRLFQKYNCISCHQIYGLGGYLGPDLTNVISAHGKGELYASAIIKYGTLIMPNMSLSDKEVEEVLAYLKYIDKTGKSPATNFNVSWIGTVEPK